MCITHVRGVLISVKGENGEEESVEGRVAKEAASEGNIIGGVVEENRSDDGPVVFAGVAIGAVGVRGVINPHSGRLGVGFEI